MSESMACPRCQAAVWAWAQFCPSCGQPISQPSQTAPQSIPAAAPQFAAPAFAAQPAPQFAAPAFASAPAPQFAAPAFAAQAAAQPYPPTPFGPGAYPASQPWAAPAYGSPYPGVPFFPGVGSRRLMGINILICFLIVTAIIYLIVSLGYVGWMSYRLDEDENFYASLDGLASVAFLVAGISGFLISWGLYHLKKWALWGGVLLCVAMPIVLVISEYFWGMVTWLDVTGYCVNIGMLIYLLLPSTRAAFAQQPQFVPALPRFR